MVFDPVVAVVVVLVLVVALGLGGTVLSDRANRREMDQVNAERREERANQERLEQERLERLEEARKEESEALEGARRQMALAQEDIAKAQQAFRESHDRLIEGILARAKDGCDDEFRQRFGITRSLKATEARDDPEVQEYLRAHYAELRDSVLAETMEELVQEEVERRLAALEEAEVPEESRAPEDAEVPEESRAPEDAEAPEEIEVQEEAEAPETDEDEVDPESEDESIRAGIEEEVRAQFDFDSARTYLLAAISARYDADGRPIGDLPWPAYTSASARGYGELVLAVGAPTYAQDSYRDFAWKKFHTGKRPEKPERGEYSWPESRELGDGVTADNAPTPAGVFSVSGPEGALPLHELVGCAWMRHSLDYQGALLVPDVQRSFFVNLAGLHKGDELALAFDGEDFLEEAEDGPYFVNAIGEVNGAYVGISASKPEAANLGEAPYELAERTKRSLVFRMTHDARRPDVDTHPQFLEVHLAWCQPPSPRPDKAIRHVAN